MKTEQSLFFSSLFVIAVIFSSCATIFGGSKYYAHILVKEHPNAAIIHNGLKIGNGSATAIVSRKYANKFSFTVKEKGCADQTFSYHTRTFRGWALVGTIFTPTFNIQGFPMLWGVGTDLANGALWKPNKYEGIVKRNYKNYQYIVSYTICENQDQNSTIIESDKLVDVVYLKNGSIIRGILIENDLTTQIKIQTNDGSIFTYKADEVLKITRE